IDPESGHPLHTYTIITQQANELMSVIHNSKQRMPLILRPENENRWLRGETLLPNEVQLVAEVV
ncbi:MAG: SOS response-associated peptidase family protein, partial [Bacteroidales bacterium]|nr:SOS response-associated peptidase family protein [Bacteroidales bacterium]